MEGLIKLDQEVLQESIGSLKKGFNEELLAQMDEAAKLVGAMDDRNSLVQQCKENLSKMQKGYNTALPQTEVFLSEIGKTYDVAEFLEKQANIGDVRNVSGVEVKGRINPDSVMI